MVQLLIPIRGRVALSGRDRPTSFEAALRSVELAGYPIVSRSMVGQCGCLALAEKTGLSRINEAQLREQTINKLSSLGQARNFSIQLKKMTRNLSETISKPAWKVRITIGYTHYWVS